MIKDCETIKSKLLHNSGLKQIYSCDAKKIVQIQILQKSKTRGKFDEILKNVKKKNLLE